LRSARGIALRAWSSRATSFLPTGAGRSWLSHGCHRCGRRPVRGCTTIVVVQFSRCFLSLLYWCCEVVNHMFRWGQRPVLWPLDMGLDPHSAGLLAPLAIALLSPVPSNVPACLILALSRVPLAPPSPRVHSDNADYPISTPVPPGLAIWGIFVQGAALLSRDVGTLFHHPQ